MTLVTVGVAALNQTPLDWDGNLARILAVIAEARHEGVTVLCLPELCIPGYGCEDAFFSPGTVERSWELLTEIASHTRGMTVAVGLPIPFEHSLFNCVGLLANGAIAGFVAKQNLAGDGIYYEPRWFRRWKPGVVATYQHGDSEYPLGDIYFSVNAIKIGFEICEDAWVAKRPGVELAQRAVDIILNPSASHFGFGRRQIRERFVLEGSRAFGCVYGYANLLGCESGRIIYDGDCLIAAGGDLIATGKRFALAPSTLTIATVDLALLRMRQASVASFLPALERDPQCVPIPPFSTASSGAEIPRTPRRGAERASAPWEISTQLKEEEFTRAITLGLYDYLRKSRSHGFVVSLSGGADSSAVSILVFYMVMRLFEERDQSSRLSDLSYIRELSRESSREECMRVLLWCVYQRTRNSSSATAEAARAVANAIHATYHAVSIDELVDRYVALAGQVIGRALTWEHDDLALQNVQARTRSPGVWLIANVRQALLLTTSNRSEAAVGYATMDGDTSGGLNPIGGIDKAFLLRWLDWVAREGPVGLGPVGAASAVLSQPPTAELRPLESHQTDEEDLMPYVVLNAIEGYAIRDKLSPKDVLLRVQEEFKSSHAIDTISDWVKRFFTLWARNQWKRERYAPSFHCDDKNLDPKTWCRFPILSGGYVRELRELEESSPDTAHSKTP